MNKNSIKAISFKFFFLAFFLMPSSNLFAADPNCENCNKLPLPAVETRSIEKVIAKASEDRYSPITNDEISEMCADFLAATNDETIELFLEKFKTNQKNPIEAFLKLKCTPNKAYSPTVKIPLIHYIPEFPGTMYIFTKQIFDFFKKQDGNNEAWLKIVNLKNQNDMTLLDLVNLQLKNQNITPNTRSKLNEIRNFVCKTGGEYSFYKSEAKCENSI